MSRKNESVGKFQQAMHVERPASFYVAILLGLFFLLVSLNKLGNPQASAEAVFRGHLIPYPLVNIGALLFMSLEFVAAVAVVFLAKYRRAGLWILVAVSLIYAGCVSVNLFRGLNTVCSCFGGGARAAAISYWTVVRNLLPALAGLFALR